MKSRHWLRNLTISVALLIIFGAAAALLYTPIMAQLASITAPPQTVRALGVASPEIPTQGDAGLNSYINMVGGKPALVHWYPNLKQGLNTTQMDLYASRGITSMISLNTSNVNPSDAQVAAGAEDSYLNAYAIAAARWGKPFFLRPDWEFNGFWYQFSVGQNGNTAASYIAMWQHLYTLFHKDGATNAKFVFCPNSMTGGIANFANMYPGDSYVDWTCIDGYNGNSSKWHSFTDEFATSYDLLQKIAPSKPMMIGEVASNENPNKAGQSKADWTRSAYFNEIPTRFPALKIIAWFNFNKEKPWQVNSSSSLLQTFREIVASPLYRGSIDLGGSQGSITFQPHVGQTPTATPSGNVTSTATTGSTATGSTATAGSTATPTPPPSTNVTYSATFDDGKLDNWSSYDTRVNLSSSTDVAKSGQDALKVSYENVGSDFHHASVSGEATHTYPKPGQTISGYVYVPNGENISAHIFLEDSSHQWHAPNMQALVTGQWDLLTYTIPANIQTPIYSIGVQFVDNADSQNGGQIYIDSVEFSS